MQEVELVLCYAWVAVLSCSCEDLLCIFDVWPTSRLAVHQLPKGTPIETQCSKWTLQRVQLTHLKPLPARHIDSGMLRETSAWRQTNTSTPCSSRIVRILSVSLSSVLAGYAPARTCPRITQLHQGVGPAMLAAFLGKAGKSICFVVSLPLGAGSGARLKELCSLLLSTKRIRFLRCGSPGMLQGDLTATLLTVTERV